MGSLADHRITARITARKASRLLYMLVGLSAMVLVSIDACFPATGRGPERADYTITSVRRSPLALGISADIPIDGRMLQMDDTYPAELPEMASGGWPSLITNLMILDSAGKELPFSAIGTRGWQLTDSVCSRLKITYEVDYSLFEAHGWSSPLESAFADDSTIAIAGRSAFITTSSTDGMEVRIETQSGWLPVVPWVAGGNGPDSYHVRSRQDLTDNMMVFSKQKPDVVTASGFRMQIVAMGHWQPLRPLLAQVLETIIDLEVHLMDDREKEVYNVVLLPTADNGGNAFRQSFAYCYTSPDRDNRDVWGNTLAHEIFHYWNYSRLRGADYQSSQWFQEGFTEYVANLVMVRGKIIDADAFIRKLSHHVNNYRKLTTTLENYGTHKGPPLYSAGALVAFLWDVQIVSASGGRRDIGDLFRNMMVQTDMGGRDYSWKDIKASMEATAEGDWEGFYQSHIRGDEPLPLEAMLPLAGLRLQTLADGSEQVQYDTAATAEAGNVWRSLIGE